MSPAFPYETSSALYNDRSIIPNVTSFTNNNSSTNIPSGINRMGRGISCVLLMAWMPGTGGISDVEYIKNRQDSGYEILQFVIPKGQRPITVVTPAQNLRRILEIIKPSISELATLFGVSRQAIYKWQAGESPSPKNAEWLQELAGAADMLVREGIPPRMQLWNRKIDGNQSLFDMVRNGQSACEGMKLLIRILRMEAEQRRQLNERLAHRPKLSRDDSDLGIPYFSDEGD